MLGRRRLLDQFFPKTVTKSLTIKTTLAVLSVTVTPTPSKGYVGEAISIRVKTTWVGPAPMHFEIAFGDGTSTVQDVSGDNVTVSKTYTSAGTFTITAKATDLSTGASGTGSASVSVASALTVTFTADKTSGNVPLTVTFTFGMSGGYPPYTWTLDPGDGSTPYSNPASPKSHTYTKEATFTAVIAVTDAQVGSATAQVTIGAGVTILFPKLREMFPKLFERIDKLRQRIKF